MRCAERTGEWASTDSFDESRAVDVVCRAGSVVLFNALVIHAAHKNTSEARTRFSVFASLLHDIRTQRRRQPHSAL